jgi:hypothetical protein
MSLSKCWVLVPTFFPEKSRHTVEPCWATTLSLLLQGFFSLKVVYSRGLTVGEEDMDCDVNNDVNKREKVVK